MGGSCAHARYLQIQLSCSHLKSGNRTPVCAARPAAIIYLDANSRESGLIWHPIIFTDGMADVSISIRMGREKKTRIGKDALEGRDGVGDVLQLG